MDASIVIRTKNESQFIGDTLRRVKEQEFRGSYEIIIIDSGSTDSTLDITKKYNVKVLKISERKFTYGRSLNIGASHAKGEFVVNLSAHALPCDNQWLANLTSGFNGHNIAGVYGKQLSIGRVNPFEALRNELFFGDKKLTFSLNDKKMLKHIHFSNGNSAIRKDIWQRFKFNEEVPYAEDVWWQREVIRAGFSVTYAPDASVYHTHSINISNTYRNSKDCAFTLALMHQRRSILMIICDVIVFLGLISIGISKNLQYIWRNNYLEFLGIAPLYVTSERFGWLIGRTKYRLNRKSESIPRNLLRG